MKYLFLISFLLVFTFASFGQDPNGNISGASISWEQPTFDFGDLKQGEKVEHTFRFVNNGNAPLIITNVEVTCGCTTPKGWPRDPIAAGAKGEITVAFNSAGKYGRQNKVVKVISNATGGQNQFSFTANVLPKEDPN